MSRIEIIKQRLERYVNPQTNTDEKLENGAIAEWVAESDGDTAWLLERVEELFKALEELSDFIAYGLDKPDGAEPTGDDLRRCRELAENARIAVDNVCA